MMANYKICFIFFPAILFLVGIDGKSYTMRLTKMEKCKLPDSKIDKTAPLTCYLSVRKINREINVVKANFTIGSRYGPVFFSLRSYQVQQNAVKDLLLKIEKQTCKNPLTFQLISSLKVKMDKDCYALPGSYESNSITTEDFGWIFSRTVVGVGKYVYEIEFSTSKGVAACFAFTHDAVEIKKQEQF